MMCNMSKNQNSCECEDNSDSGLLQINSEDPGCCKINISEINNSNTLDKTSKTSVKIYSLLITYFLPEAELSKIQSNYKLFTNFHKPPSDIPILNSTFLI